MLVLAAASTDNTISHCIVKIFTTEKSRWLWPAAMGHGRCSAIAWSLRDYFIPTGACVPWFMAAAHNTKPL
jgi:hypothetical protein